MKTQIKKYYISSDFNYAQTLKIYKSRKDFVLSEFAAPMFVPLIRTEKVELTIDLAQYTENRKALTHCRLGYRTKYMNICRNPIEIGKNCTINWIKCRSAMLIIESFGKVDLYKEVFDVDLFRSQIRKVKVNTMERYWNEELCSSAAVDFTKKRGTKYPPYILAEILQNAEKFKRLPMIIRGRLGNGAGRF